MSSISLARCYTKNGEQIYPQNTILGKVFQVEYKVILCGITSVKGAFLNPCPLPVSPHGSSRRLNKDTKKHPVERVLSGIVGVWEGS